MTNAKIKLSLLYIFLSALALMLALPAFSPNVCDAGGVRITPKVIGFYEESIAEDDFISSMNDGTRGRLKSIYDVDDNRLNIMLILQDLGARVNKPQNLQDLSQMRDNQLLSLGKTLINDYTATLTAEKKAALKNEFLSLLKG